MPEPIAAAVREELRLLYEHSALSVAQICAQTGVSTGRFYRMAKKHNWTRRRHQDEQTAIHCVAGNDKENAAKARHMTFNRLRGMIERELDLLARLQGEGDKREPLTPDQAARTFASLVKTLSDLKKLQDETCGNNDHDATEDIETVRSELAQRLDRLRAAASKNN